MITFHIITIFPEIIEVYIKYGILGKALKNKILNVKVYNLRDFTTDKHKTVDDIAYGGRAGMIMKCEPIFHAVNEIKKNSDGKTITILLDPKGNIFSQSYAENLKSYNNVVLICGHYGGVDQRVKDLVVDELISIGDYILSGGELPALVILDSTARLVDNVVGCKNSLEEDSFYNNLLSAPQYTRPYVFKGLKVPDVLLSGNHKEIEKWVQKKRIEETKKYRPELLKKRNNKILKGR